jgi:cytochrome c-type biogenesis protein CcmH
MTASTKRLQSRGPAKAGTHFAENGSPARLIRAFAGTFIGNFRRVTPMALAMLFATVIAVYPAYAVRPDEMLPDPVMESRARSVGEELRCLVCRNQSIEESEADLAHDLRLVVRERIKAGDSDAQIITYIRSRYGDFVLLRPPLTIGTALLWAGPALILLLGGIAVARFHRARRTAPAPPPLSADERKRLAAVLADSNQP